MKVEIRCARDHGEVHRAYELAARVFGPNYFEAARRKARLQITDPVKSFGDAIVAIDKGEIVGFVRLLDRAVRVGGAVLQVGGVTSVAVHPNCRGRGVGFRIMDAAVERCVERKDVLSVAFARRAVDGFYPKFGYLGFGVHSELTFPPLQIPQIESPLPESRRPRISTGGLEWAADSCAAAYEDSYGPIPFSFGRNKAWWVRALSSEHDHPASVEVFKDNDDVIGYAAFVDDLIVEVAALRGCESRVCSRVIRPHASSLCRVRAPQSHWFFRQTRGLNRTLSLRFAWDGGHVVRVIDAPSTIAACIQAGMGDEDVLGELAQNDTRDHQAALRMLKLLAGSDESSKARGQRSSESLLPTWSPLDEF